MSLARGMLLLQSNVASSFPEAEFSSTAEAEDDDERVSAVASNSDESMSSAITSSSASSMPSLGIPTRCSYSCRLILWTS